MLDVSADLALQHDDNRCQNIGYRDVIALISGLVLNCLVINDITLDHMETVCRNMVGFQILTYSHNSVLVQISTKHALCAQL